MKMPGVGFHLPVSNKGLNKDPGKYKNGQEHDTQDQVQHGAGCV
jgi:hypothetical protein